MERLIGISNRTPPDALVDAYKAMQQKLRIQDKKQGQ